MIDKILIKKVATFSDEGITISDLKKINFIYGSNGCGKTTISNFLHNSSSSNFSNCSIEWKNDTPVDTLVYNKEFRERNFGQGKLGGIFTLGEATAEEIEVIDSKKEQLKNVKIEIVARKSGLATQEATLENLENTFKDNAWTAVYKKYEVIFNEAFEGVKSKDRFKNKLLIEFTSNTKTLLTIQELQSKALTIFGEAPTNINLIPILNYDRITEIIENSIWKKIIIGKANVDIAGLIQKLNINDWVNQGRNYILDETCPFCQEKTISDNFKKQLNDYFDESYLRDIQEVNTLKNEYDQAIENLLNELNSIENFQKSYDKSKLENDTFSAYLKTLTSQIATNNGILNNKIKEPSRIFDLVPLKEQLILIYDLIKNANANIIQHNAIVTNFATEKANLIQSVWKFLIEEYRPQITSFNLAKVGMERGISNVNTQLNEKIATSRQLDLEIKELSKNVTSIQPTIDEINRLLKSYGFLNFEILPAPEEGFYQIHREDGSIAETTLSEGEITFITFLYYLQLAKGGISEETVNNERLLVIDDPISSLDSNVLFVVSTLIKEIIKNIRLDIGNIKQIILLTHNVYFHKEVSFEGINRGPGERSLYWILRKNNRVSGIQFYGNNNPILSSYDLLWREIREWDRNSGITIQNTMRRILENYFSILGNKKDEFLINGFDNPEEKDICRSLISWINEGSHTLPDDLYIEAPDDTIGKYLEVFKGIFQYTDNMGHYNMMMQIEPL